MHLVDDAAELRLELLMLHAGKIKDQVVMSTFEALTAATMSTVDSVDIIFRIPRTVES